MFRFIGYFRFSLYLTWLSSAFFVIGGGGFTASAVMLAMTADVVPANKRYFRFTSPNTFSSKDQV